MLVGCCNELILNESALSELIVVPDELKQTS
jgi:hypothetical protein